MSSIKLPVYRCKDNLYGVMLFPTKKKITLAVQSTPVEYIVQNIKQNITSKYK